MNHPLPPFRYGSRASLFRSRLLWRLVGALILAGSLALGEDPVPKEYQLKAAFLYNFTKFIEWTPSKLGSPDSPIVIGILGTNPFGGALENAVLNRKVNGREIVVRHVQSIPAARSAHLLFVSANEDGHFGELRDALKSAGVLTVGESPAFARSGGIITFAIEGDKMRFDINTAGADLAGIRISAQLQKLARAVRKQPPL